MTPTPLQQFGSLETDTGKAYAMLCVDADRPNEFMVHAWGENLPSVGLLMGAAIQSDGAILLTPKNLYRTSDNGSLFLPRLTEEEVAHLRGISALLTPAQGGGFDGEWTGPEQKSGSIQFRPSPAGDLAAQSCPTWDDFKQWAGRSRQTLDAALFRGHGDSKFRLQTTLHRAGRHRLERYCAETLQHFHGEAEALLGVRLDMNDGADYSVVLGLGQHHGLPTPLLDWTESPYVAAFFAFADALEAAPYRPNATHVRIFALAREFVERNSPPSVSLPFISPYAVSLAISPRHNPRLQAQQGRFLVTNVANLERWIDGMQTGLERPLLHAVDIPISVASDALEDLAFMGVTAASMFPGLDGVCRKIRHQMSFGRSRIPDAGRPTGEPERRKDGATSADKKDVHA